MPVTKAQPRFSFPIAHLLSPIRSDVRPMVMPHERGSRKRDSATHRLEAPTHVDVVAGA
jgi:hypothetical protein